MKSSILIHDMIRICPQTGRVVEQESRNRSLSELEKEILQLTSPRNAYVSFQLIVRLDGTASPDLDLMAEALTGKHGEIASAEYSFYVQWYHKIQDRYIPDALVPWGAGNTSDRPFASVVERNPVPEQAFSALWIDLFVPKHTRPGAYQGNIYVTRGTDKETLPIKLQVLETSVPDESLIIADLNSYADNLSTRMAYLRRNGNRYNDGTYFRVERQFFRMAHEHRCLFHYLPYSHSGDIPESFAPELEGKGKYMRVKDWSLFDEHFGSYLDGSAFRDTKRGPIPLPHMYLPFNFHWPADYVKFGTKGYRTEFASIFDEFHRHFTEHGWLYTQFELFLNHKKRYKLFPYDGDETRFVWDEKISDIFYDLGRNVLSRKEGAQFLFRTDSSWCFGQHYSKYAKIIRHWVVSETIGSWYPEGIAQLKADGCEVWTYGGAQKIGQSLLGTVITPMSAIARGVDGFLYWENIDWGEQWHIAPASDGATALFYPGDQLFGLLGPLPSIRLKVLRNAMQVGDCMERWIRKHPEKGRGEISGMIAAALGTVSGAWWPGKPEFADKPPYEWMDTMFSVAPRATIQEGQPPEAFNDLKRNLWKKLG